MLLLLLACIKGSDSDPGDSAVEEAWSLRGAQAGCSVEGSFQVDGALQATWTLDFDRWGNPAQRVDDSNADGTVDLVQQWSWDDERLLDAGMDGTGDGKLDFLYLYTYDTEGNLVRRDTDLDVDGSLDSHREYDWSGGQLVEERWDMDWDDAVDATASWTYDSADRPLARTWSGQLAPDDETWAWSGDDFTHEILDKGEPSNRDGGAYAGELLVRAWKDANLTDSPEWSVDYTHDERGLVTLDYQVGTFDEWDPGNTTVAWTRNGTWTYDEAGRLVSVLTRFDQGGVLAEELRSQRWSCD